MKGNKGLVISTLLFLITLSLFIFNLRLQKGCGDEAMCWGPDGYYLTLCGHELINQEKAFLFALFALVLTIALGNIRKYELRKKLLFGVSISLWVLLSTVYFSPVIVVY